MTQDMRHEFPVAPNGVYRHVNGSSRTPQKNAIANGTNGHASPINGMPFPRTNGVRTSKASTKGPDFYGHDREEVTRLLIQGLEELGYKAAAETLSQESGYKAENPPVAAFRHSILEGSWSKAEALLIGRVSEPEGGGVSISNGNTHHRAGLKLVEDADQDQMRFMIREQKYLELLRRGDRAKALRVLQTELQPLNYDTSRLHLLSGLMVSHSTDDQDMDTVWESRQKLLTELSRLRSLVGFVSPTAMIPPRRLAALLDQVHRAQVSRCLYHNPLNMRPLSLFVDHMCIENNFPLRTSLELSQSGREVWFVEFSHNGRFLAASGESSFVIIYNTRTFDVRYRLGEHDNSVVFVSWSPDDSRLITCCQDAKARVWDMATGRCLQVINHHGQAVTTAAWTPDGNAIVTGSLDRHGQLCLRSVDGHEPFYWPTELRTQDCAITPDGQRLLVMSTDNYITVYNLPTRMEEYSIKVYHRMTCITVSRDSRNMLVNMENDEIHLIDIETANIIRRYTGQQQCGNVIRSAFGGADEGLVISGSSNSKVYIWHKENGTLIETLEGHTKGCVNTVAWNPADPTMFASGGDDRKVRIWTKDPEPPSLQRRRTGSHLSRYQRNYERSL
ncbi:MAG: hypothetical protein Q9163_005925 [Psora crenata]